MAARDRPTQSYAQLPYATTADRAALATRQRTNARVIDDAATEILTATMRGAPQQWSRASATDLIGECVRVRSELVDSDDRE